MPVSSIHSRIMRLCSGQHRSRQNYDGIVNFVVSGECKVYISVPWRPGAERDIENGNGWVIENEDS